MYCSSCGTQLAQASTYCKHCGAQLRAVKSADDSTPHKTIDSLIWVIVGTTIIILGMCLGSLVLMSDKAIDFALGTVFVILSFAALVVVDSVLIWRLMQMHKSISGARDLVQRKDSDTRDQREDRARALQEPPEAVASVTEHTTRAFEPSYREDDRT